MLWSVNPFCCNYFIIYKLFLSGNSTGARRNCPSSIPVTGTLQRGIQNLGTGEREWSEPMSCCVSFNIDIHILSLVGDIHLMRRFLLVFTMSQACSV